MKIKFTGHNIEVTDALKEYAQTKFSHLDKFKLINNIHIIFNVDGVMQSAEAQIKVPGTEIHAQAKAEDMYIAIDELVHKTQRQLVKFKEKHASHRE